MALSIDPSFPRSLPASHYDCDDDDRSLPAPFMFNFLPPSVTPSGKVLFSFASRPPSLRPASPLTDLARKLWKAAEQERKERRPVGGAASPFIYPSDASTHAEVTTVNTIDCILSNPLYWQICEWIDFVFYPRLVHSDTPLLLCHRHASWCHSSCAQCGACISRFRRRRPSLPQFPSPVLSLIQPHRIPYLPRATV